LPSIIRRISQPFLRILFFPIQYLLIRNIFTQNNGDKLIVMNGGFPGGESCRLANIVWFNMNREPGVHNFHNFAVVPRFGLGWYENWLDRMLLKSTKLFISVSKSCSDSIKVRKTFKNLKNVRRIYNGISDTSSEENVLIIRDSLGIGNNPLCIMLGNYEPRKGHQFIFEVFKGVLEVVPNAHLVVCGGGTKDEIAEVNNTKEKIAPNGNVHLLGFIPNGASLINQADVLLIGSQEFESFGLTAVEAMIRQKPIVTTDTGGLPEVVGLDDTCGYIVGHKDAIGFAEKVVFLLRNKELRESMGKLGRTRALELFSADRMAKEYLDAIKE